MPKRTSADSPAKTSHAVRPARSRVRPLTIAAAVALILLGVLGSVFAYQATARTHAVVGIRNDVQRGAVIAAADLQTVQVGVDPALHPVPGNQLASMVGKRAARDLSAGSLLTASDVSDTVVPAKDESVLGLALAPGMLPSEPLLPGDKVRIVPVPTTVQGATSAPKPLSAAIPGVVVSVSKDPSNPSNTIVNVSVAASQAIDLAAAAGAGKVVVVLESRER